VVLQGSFRPAVSFAAGVHIVYCIWKMMAEPRRAFVQPVNPERKLCSESIRTTLTLAASPTDDTATAAPGGAAAVAVAVSVQEGRRKTRRGGL